MVAALLSAILISGCQTVGSTDADKPYQSYSGSRSESKYFPVELDNAARALGRELANQCAAAGQKSALEACFRQKTAEAFQTPDIGLKACQDVQHFGQYSECISIGTIADHLRQKISSAHRPQMIATDWRSPDAYLKNLMKGEILDITDKCFAGALADVDHCTRTELARFADVSEHFQQSCETTKDSEQFGNCLGEALGVQFLQQAADRLAAKSA